MSRGCCWRGDYRVGERWRCGPHSEQRGNGWLHRCLRKYLLGLAGGAGGLLLGYLLLVGMRQFLEKAFARGGDVRLNFAAVAATFVISLLASVATGLIPAWRAACVDPNHSLKSGGTVGTTRTQHRMRATFVVMQLALSLVLLACSGLLLLGLRSMLERDYGFNPKRLLTLEVDIPSGEYKGRDYVQALVLPLEARVHAIPGVTAVGSNDLMPILQWGSNSILRSWETVRFPRQRTTDRNALGHAGLFLGHAASHSART